LCRINLLQLAENELLYDKMAKGKSNLIFFIHEDGKKCTECLEVGKLVDEMRNVFKKKKIGMQMIADNSYEGVFRTERLPLLRIDAMPPKHYSGLSEIRDYLSSCKYN
jgi:hypothetical protein